MGLAARLFSWALLCVGSADPPLLPNSRPRTAASARYYPWRQLLDCTGSNFSGRWDDFRQQVASNAEQGFPEDEHLLANARQVHYDLAEHALARSMLQVRVYLRQEQIHELRDFCLFAYAAALLIMFRHDCDASYIQHLHDVMGWNEWPLDFSESSGWPTFWRIVPYHFEKSLQENLDCSWIQSSERFGREEALLPNPSPAEVEIALLRWLAMVGVPVPDRSDALSIPMGFAPFELMPFLTAQATPLRILVVGHHIGSSLEPFTMLKKAMKIGVNVRLEAQFHGQRHPAPKIACKDFGYCNHNEAFEAWVRQYEWLHGWVGEYEWMIDRWPNALETLADVLRRDAFMSRAHFVICGGPAWLCTMIRAVKPIAMFLYFAWPLVPLIPRGVRPQFLLQIQSLGQASSPPAIMVCANWIVVAQFALQVRLPVHLQRVHGLYTNQTYAPRLAENGNKRVMFSRMGIWTGQSGPALLELLWSYFGEAQQHSRGTFRFEPVFLSIKVRGITPILHLSYQEMAQFHACVFWPWDVMMMLFSELYTMTVPLLLPDKHWVVNTMLHVLRQTDQNWWHIRAENVKAALPMATSEEFPLPFEPWLAGVAHEGLEQATYWYTLTEFEQYPYVTHFRSWTELIEQLRSLDVAQVRAGMRRFNKETQARSLDFYRWAAASLLSSGKDRPLWA